jgi:hypothetical protein
MFKFDLISRRTEDMRLSALGTLAMKYQGWIGIYTNIILLPGGWDMIEEGRGKVRSHCIRSHCIRSHQKGR